MKRPPVLTKKDFVRRYALGEFGNASPTWNTFKEWFEDRPWRQYGDLFHVRNRVAGGKTWYDVRWSKVRLAWIEAVACCGKKNLYISAMCPTAKTLFQGEVERGLWGYNVTYTTVAKPMREALAESTRLAQGVQASLLLKHYLCPNSLEWLEYLLETYRDHVVEFTTLSVEWGTVPGFNTLFWEVRKY